MESTATEVTELEVTEINADYTSSSRGVSDSIKRKVCEADPNKGLCLVENSRMSIQYSHCVAEKHMRDKEMQLDLLEWYWNMKCTSLNLNSRYNIFCLDTSLHILFDTNSWLLLPEPSVIEKFERSVENLGGTFIAMRERFPVFSEKTFFYKFVHLKGLENERIQRRNNLSTDGTPATWTDHYYPFDTLPLLESHLHPKFAIFDAGRKINLLQLKVQKVVNESAISDRLSFVLRLYEAWMRPRPNVYKRDRSYLAPVDDKCTTGDDSDDSDDGVQVDDEIDEDYGPASKKKKKATAKTAIKRKRMQLQKVLSDQQCLSEVALSRLLDQEGRDAIWTDDRIREWSNPQASQKKFRTRKKIRL